MKLVYQFFVQWPHILWNKLLMHGQPIFQNVSLEWKQSSCDFTAIDRMYLEWTTRFQWAI